jgi:hypothetical protein
MAEEGQKPIPRWVDLIKNMRKEEPRAKITYESLWFAKTQSDFKINKPR